MRAWFEREFTALRNEAGSRRVPATHIISREGEEAAYLDFHKERFFTVLERVKRCYRPGDAILDVGTSHLTLLLGKLFSDVSAVDIADGWGEPAKAAGVAFARADVLSWKPRRAWNIVVYAEILEHLPVPPFIQLQALRRLLQPQGILILTTPNATSYYHRRDMFRGKNPFMPPPDSAEVPFMWHVREYTAGEVRNAASRTGFTVLEQSFPRYWNNQAREGVVGAIKRVCMNTLFSATPSLRDGMLFVFRKE